MKLNEHQQNALRSWDALNAYVRTVKDEAVCLALIEAELAMPSPRTPAQPLLSGRDR